MTYEQDRDEFAHRVGPALTANIDHLSAVLSDIWGKAVHVSVMVIPLAADEPLRASYLGFTTFYSRPAHLKLEDYEHTVAHLKGMSAAYALEASGLENWENEQKGTMQ